MISTILQYVHNAMEAMTPWLAGMAVVFFLLWLATLIWEKKPFAKELKWFNRLAPLHKFFVGCAVCFFTLWGGSKEQVKPSTGLIGDISSTVPRVCETIQLRILPENVAPNAFAVTDFAADSQKKETAFEVGWISNLFENVDSRNVDLFMSTNLAVKGWFPLARYLMPQNTNSYMLTVSSNDVVLAYRPIYVDSFSQMAFFRFGLDFDSDGDGLTDSYESFTSFTNPTNPDTDRDGLSDGRELAANIDTDPLLYDTDGDGVEDGDEIAAGSNPHSADSDEDGLSDVIEFGTMSALKEDNFMWFDISGGTDLLASSSTANDNTWTIALPQNTIINNVCHTNALVCMNGVVHLLCPTNSSGTRLSSYSYSGGLSNTQWSAMHVTVALFNANLYARTANWDSKILYGTIESEGRRYGVIEYRNVGLYSLRNAESNELLTCQMIIPADETNTVYVSYLCASNAFREISVAAGVQCGRMRSWKSGESYYNLSWPLTSEFPEEGLTIKYSIGSGTSPCNPDTDGDGLHDAEEALFYRTDPLVLDSDGDIILDAEEIAIGTKPLSADTDGDGMPDGWEVLNNLNPLIDDSADDPDGDGLANLREYASGTSPGSVDTDDDGLIDRDEIGWWEYVDSMPVFDVSRGTNLLLTSKGYYYNTFNIPLPFIFRCGGLLHTNIMVGVNGLVGLLSDREAQSFNVSEVNRDMTSYTVNRYHTTIAAYWDYLCAPANSGAQITVADVETNGLRCAVIEYSKIRLYSHKNDASCVATFQIVIPESETNTVYVHYINMSDAFDGSSATVGAQLPNGEQSHQVSFNTVGAVTNGMIIAYHFGTGSNPTIADTDADGLDDVEEDAIGTSVRYTDTDNDGLPDEWEVSNGIDPQSDSGVNGADGDSDADLLSNIKEFEYGTSPWNGDMDEDGLCDGVETGSIFVTNAVPWLEFDAFEDITVDVSTNSRRCVTRTIPVPLRIQGVTVTNMTISANGILFLDRVGYVNAGRTLSSSSFTSTIDGNTIAIAPWLDYLYIRNDIPDRISRIRFGTASHNNNGYILVEYENAYLDTLTTQTNSISFQLAIPMASADRAYVRYCNLTGRNSDGGGGDIGMQTFTGRWSHSYCDNDSGRIWEDLGLVFLFGANSDPLYRDSDCDNLLDGLEFELNTNPLQPDTDGDGMNDGWEYQHSSSGFSPIENGADDSNVGNDSDSDPDGDGLTNSEECEWGTNPDGVDKNGDGIPDGYDTDGDGVGDGDEVARGSDPKDQSDGGLPNSRVPVKFSFGDHSASHSEKYRLEIVPVLGMGDEPSSFSWINENYGECETRTAMLKAGWKYEIRLKHAGTNGDGSGYPDYDYRLLCIKDALPKNVIVADPDLLFGTDDTSSFFAAGKKVATISVYAVERISICKPDDPLWMELEESRVLLDEEELRVKIEIAPTVESVAQLRQIFGDSLTIKTTGTCPAGASVPIADDSQLVNSSGKSEIRIAKTRQELILLGLLPPKDDDGVDEMAWVDIVQTAGQSLVDSEAFSSLSYAFRGKATSDTSNNLESTPPNSAPSTTYMKSAGCEILNATYGETTSDKRQIMNQADVFYYSGHGNGATGGINSGFTPNLLGEYWKRDLNCAVIAGCSVLNIAGYRIKSFGMATRFKRWYRNQQDRSVGASWEVAADIIFLGYCYTAPLDNQGAVDIATDFSAKVKGGMGYLQAWKEANDRNAGRNACAIDCTTIPHSFWYWDETSGNPVWTRINKGTTSW